MTTTGLIAALGAEARVLGRAALRPDGLTSLADGSLVAVSGVGCLAAAAAARALIDAGATALLSFGLAGGLDPTLQPGDIVLPREVIGTTGERYPTSNDWRARLDAALGAQRAVAGTLLTSLVVIASVAGKTAAFRDSGAVAVDMESLGIARIAAESRLPFIAARVVIDTAHDALPGSVAAAGREGPLRIGRLLRELALAPSELVAIVRLARRYRMAMRSLTLLGRACCPRAA